MPVIGSGKSVYGGIYQATASGAIADGKAVIINTDGTVSQAASIPGLTFHFLQYNRLYRFDLASAYDPMTTTSGSYSAAYSSGAYKDSYGGALDSNTNSCHALNYKPDGTKLFISDVNGTSSKIQEFNLTTAFDPSTLVYVDGYTIGAKTAYPYGMDFKPDGTEVYVCSYGDSDVHQWTLSTAWDISTASVTRPFNTTRDDYRHGITFKPDGTKMYITGGNYTTDDSTDQYTLSTAWDISTASYDYISLDHSSYITNPEDLKFNADGTYFYVYGSQPYTRLVQYSLSTAYNLNTASYVTMTGPPITSIQGISFGNGGIAEPTFFGMSVGAVSNGETASIRVLGGLDTNQSGLTPNAAVYAALDGTVTSTNTGFAQIGWALSPTTILIRGSYKNIL